MMPIFYFGELISLIIKSVYIHNARDEIHSPTTSYPIDNDNSNLTNFHSAEGTANPRDIETNLDFHSNMVEENEINDQLNIIGIALDNRVGTGMMIALFMAFFLSLALLIAASFGDASNSNAEKIIKLPAEVK